MVGGVSCAAATMRAQETSTNFHWWCSGATFPHHTSHDSRYLKGSKVPYQYHVTSGDVHVGWHWLLTPGGGTAAGGGAGCRAIAELRGDAVESRVAQGLWPLDALRRPDRHPLATKLLGITGDKELSPNHEKGIIYTLCKVSCLCFLFMHITMILRRLRAYPCSVKCTCMSADWICPHSPVD